MRASFSGSCISNSLSCRDWELDQVPVVGNPTHMVQRGTGHRLCISEGQWRVAVLFHDSADVVSACP
jgi:hypothetical protein